MKALFLIFHGFSEHNGISKKIYSQVKAMRQCGVDTVLCYTSFDGAGNQLRMADNQVVKNYGNGLWGKISKRICLSPIYSYVVDNNIDLVYMRTSHNANPFLIHLLDRLKRRGVQIVMEVPTYPYDMEYKGVSLKFKLRILIDKTFRNRLAKKLYRIITFTGVEQIFGVPTIRISNAIDFDTIPVKSHLNDTQNEIHLLGVAELHFWHGYDRVIAGLAAYYQTSPAVKVIFHVVGEGFDGYVEKYRSMAAELAVGDYVILYGNRSGSELDAFFEKADIGIGSLGRHRSGITYIKTLKNREYAARGIPFVYSEIDEDFEDKPYVLKAPADETPLDIAQLVLFYAQTPHSPVDIRASIESTLSWKAQMLKVIDLAKNPISQINFQEKT